jgi:hypothetical protein
MLYVLIIRTFKILQERMFSLYTQFYHMILQLLEEMNKM